MIPRIIIDSRELKNPVAKNLERMGAELEFTTLEIGDYILSDRIGIERKTAQDGINSLIGEEKGKIFRQCRDLVESYQKPLLIFECELSDLFTRNIHPGAIWGMLRSILWSGCPVEFTYTSEGTAKKLFELAQVEQTGLKKPFSPHGMKTKRNPKEEKEYVISSIPEIGGSLAPTLLMFFGNVQGIASATEEQLMAVEGIGQMKARRIREVCGGQY